MIIALIVLFAAGVGNFAMHRAFMESDDPLIQQMIQPLAKRAGPHVTYVFEFLLLVGAMAIAYRDAVVAILLYGLYTAFNAMAFSWVMNRPK